jgi:SAM-dependent methyltransferase
VYVKRALRKVMAWYMRFLAQEVTAFAGAITRAVKLLGRRVDTIESVTVLAGERTLAEVRERRAGPDLGPWVDVVTTAFAGATGRILHAECGAGDLLAPLAKAGAEVYGVEPVETLAMEASRLGLDVRADDALSHLRALPPATLGGIVLSGCIDALPLGEVLELTDRAVAALVPGATLVIASGGAGALDPVVVDLAPGRPLHPDTWLHLLSQRGLTGAHATMTGPAPLAAVPSGTPGADVINANTERLNRALFGSGPYAVIARKP